MHLSLSAMRRTSPRVLRVRRRGFTVLELAVTLALVGIVMATAVPYVYGMRARSHLRGAARTLAGQLEQARTLARSAQTGFQGWSEDERVLQSGTRFSEGSYAIYVDADDVSDGQGEVTVSRVQLDSAHVLDASHSEIRFRRNGTLVGEVPLEITLRDIHTGAEFRVHVSYGGRVKLLP